MLTEILSCYVSPTGLGHTLAPGMGHRDPLQDARLGFWQVTPMGDTFQKHNAGVGVRGRTQRL